MDAFGAGGMGGDGPRDMVPNREPYSQAQSYSDEGNRRFPSNSGGSRLDLGRIDLNSEAFPPPGGFQAYLQGTPAAAVPYGYGMGPTSGYGPPPPPVFGGPYALGFVPAYGPPYGVGRGSLGGGDGSAAVAGDVGPGTGGRRRRPRGVGGVAAGAGSGGGRGGRGRGAAPDGGQGRGRGAARGGGAGRGRGFIIESDHDEGDDEDNGEADNEFPDWTESECPRSHWNDEKIEILLDILIDAKNRGSYSNGNMKSRGYNYVLVEFFRRTGVKQHKGQIRNRLGQLKSMYSICERLHNQTGRGALRNGWPKASNKWWKQALKGKGLAEFKNLKNGAPPYFEKLKDVFQGVAVDGSSAFHPGDNSEQEEGHEQDEQDEQGDDDEDHEDWAEPTANVSNSSPVSSGSRKRGSSTGTTGASPAKKMSRSPMVRVLKSFTEENKEAQEARLNFMRQQNEQHMAFLERQAQMQAELERRKVQMLADLEMTREERKAKKQAEEMAVLRRMQEIALADGWDTGSMEYMALPVMWTDIGARTFWLDSKTPESRHNAIRNYIKINQI
ncbi:hypothetical protein EJB05_55346, partial [Eragrostis curvula]